MKLLIVSTSTVYGKPYLSYLEEECKDFFPTAGNILFIPYARPGGISHDGYTAKAKEVLESWGFSVKGAHEFASAEEGCNWADGFFTGGGNTFVLANDLRESGYFEAIDAAVRSGKPYMGTSAGCNMTGQSISTTMICPSFTHHPSRLSAGYPSTSTHTTSILLRDQNTWVKRVKRE